jgi:hypothetical protein
MQDPELTIDRALEQYLQLGYSENWISQRLKSIEIRKELTDEWKSKGLKKGNSSKVNVHEPWEANWWCAEFNCIKA